MASPPYPMTDAEWEILDQLDRGVLRWRPAVGRCWKNLVKHGYVKPNFGTMTGRGKAVLEKWRKDVDRQQ